MGTPEPDFQPYVPDADTRPEFTMRAVLAGAILGIIFGASSLYLVLKVGLTVSASIPVAVLAITLFRAFGLKLSILENNIVQTAGSAGESIAFGVGVTMPALMLLGFDMTLSRVMFVAVIGGLLGILMMIPLRRVFVVRLHQQYPNQPGTLLYPEGTACAEVLKTGEAGGTSGATVFLGFGLSILHKIVCEGMNLLKATVSVPFGFFHRSAALASDMASEMLGVGYILGPRVGGIMMAGAVLGYLVIVPLIAIFGGASEVAIPPGKIPLKALTDDKIIEYVSKNYLRFIGAGCVAAAGIISMMKTLPMILHSLMGLGSLRGATGAGGIRRTERDLPMGFVLLGTLALVGVLAAFLMTEVPMISAIAGGLLVILFGFLFVTVSSRLTGEVGSSSNPISGMTIATLTMTCLIFLSLGWTSPTERVLALTIGAVVCVAASNGGTTSQDLKTGFLVGGTPKYQQYAILIGALSSALVFGVFLLLFNQAGTVYSKKAENLPTGIVVPADQLATLPAEEYQGKSYRVWRPSELQEKNGVPGGRYLVDETGKPVILVDPAITGRLKQDDDGKDVKMKFGAPKTAVIGIVINGVLKQDLKWDYILLGAMIALTLELCGVSSLAFAVGVYVPIAVSTPIFIGGLIRWLVDSIVARRGGSSGDEVESIAKTETSPGVLLASGYIAGGSLGGVLIAFLEFLPSLKEKLDLADMVKHLSDHTANLVSLGFFALLCLVAIVVGLRRQPSEA